MNYFLKSYVLFLIISFSILFHITANMEKLAEVGISAKEKIAIEDMQEMMNILRNKTIWPGYDIATTPTLFTFANGHIYGLNFEKLSSKWGSILLRKGKVLFSPKDVWHIGGIPLNPKVQIEGETIFVISLDQFSNDSLLQKTTFVHERFHRYQQERFIEGLEMEGDYHDHLDSDNLALMMIEEKILAKFLSFRGSSENTKQIKRNLIADFIVVSQTRRKLLKNSSLIWEDSQQKIEGLADYVSIKMLDIVDSSNNEAGMDYLQWQLENYASDENVAERAIKWRHYGMGAALGYALDFLEVSNWKVLIENGKGLISILEDTLKLSSDEKSSRLEKIKEQYDFKNTKEKSKIFTNRYKQLISDLRSEYENNKGIAVIIEKPSLSVSGGGSNAGLYFLGDAGTLSVDDNSSSSTHDHSWNLRLNSPHILFQTKAGAREFKVESGLKIVVDSKVYKLEEIKRPLNFSTIFWEGKNSQFSSHGHTGKIEMKEGKALISYQK
jgi:hypothetical protein